MSFKFLFCIATVVSHCYSLRFVRSRNLPSNIIIHPCFLQILFRLCASESFKEIIFPNAKHTVYGFELAVGQSDKLTAFLCLQIFLVAKLAWGMVHTRHDARYTVHRAQFVPTFWKCGIVINDGDDHIRLALELLLPAFTKGVLHSNCVIEEALPIYANKTDITSLYKQVCSAASAGVSVIIGPRSAETGKIVEEICREMKLLYVNYFWRTESPKTNETNSVSIFPARDQSSMLTQLIQTWDWDYFLFLYTEREAPLQVLPAFLKADDPPALLRMDGTSEKDIMRAALVLRQICDMRICWRHVNRVVVDLNPLETMGILSASLKLGMINIHNWFLLTRMDDLEIQFEQYIHNNMRISLTSMWPGGFNPQHEKSQILQQLYSTWRSKLEIQLLTPYQDFAYLHDTLQLLCNLQPQTDNPRMCSDVLTLPNMRPNLTRIKPFYGLTGPISFTVNNERTATRILLWELGFRGRSHITGKWSSDKFGNKRLDINSRNVEGTHDHYRNMIKTQNLIRVTTIEEAPYLIQKIQPNGKVIFEGFCVDILNKLAEYLKFDYQLTIVKDGRYGEPINNGTEWDGMVGEILRGEVDMAVAPITVTAGRLEVIDFTDPFLQLGISMLMRQPNQQTSHSFTSFLWPLSPSVWTFSAISTLATALLVTVVAVLSPTESPDEFNLTNSVWYLLCILLRAGSGFNCQSSAARFLSTIWWIFTLVLFAQYTANFAALLTVDRKSMPFNSFEELGNQSEYSYGAMQRGSTLQFFKYSRIETFRRIYENMLNSEPSAFVETNAAGVKRVLNDKYVFLMESSTLDYQVTKNCNLTRVGNVVLGSNGYSIALPKGSKWREKLTRQILDMNEKGIIMELKNNWWKNNQDQCGNADDTDASSLGGEHVQGLFALLASGVCFGIIVALVEKFCFTLLSRKKLGTPKLR